MIYLLNQKLEQSHDSVFPDIRMSVPFHPALLAWLWKSLLHPQVGFRDKCGALAANTAHHWVICPCPPSDLRLNTTHRLARRMKTLGGTPQRNISALLCFQQLYQSVLGELIVESLDEVLSVCECLSVSGWHPTVWRSKSSLLNRLIILFHHHLLVLLNLQPSDKHWGLNFEALLK